MPRKRKSSLSRNTAKSRRLHAARATETEEGRLQRIASQRASTSNSRENMTPRDRQAELEGKRLQTAAARAVEPPDHREQRLQAVRVQTAAARAVEPPDHREQRLQAVRVQTAAVRAIEPLEHRLQRLETDRDRHAHATPSQEQREQRNRSRRLRRTAAQVPVEIVQPQCLQTWTPKEGCGFRYDPHIDYKAAAYIGEMDRKCTHCSALKFRGEPEGMCCSGGKVCLPQLPPLSEPIGSLIRGEREDSPHFLQNIRAYNSAFVMTSFGSSVVDERPDGYMPTFKIRGQPYHRIGSLRSHPGQEEQFLQLYFVDDMDRQAALRASHFPVRQTRLTLIKELQHMLHRENPLVQALKTALENGPSNESLRVCLRADGFGSQHPRRFNIPTVDEVAVILVDDQHGKRDIVLRERGGGLQYVKETHRFYDAMQYPLMFPHGEEGYNLSLTLKEVQRTRVQRVQRLRTLQQQRRRTKMTAKMYYAYRLMIREEHNHLLCFGDLTNQFITDMYAKIESDRLNYHRFNQTKLRSEQYVHLQDAVTEERRQGNDVGRPVILPSTFVGSPRYMQQKLQDSLTYVRKHERPSLFLTFTTNPNWKEITSNLYDGQLPKHRHDIVSRVFKQKTKRLLTLLVDEKIFGTIDCYAYTVEWQKRGLPHIHMLLWPHKKIRPNQIDEVISAELPDPQEDPELFEIITKNMIHGPCSKSFCLDNKGNCTKRYPRRFVGETMTSEDGYPTYRRRSPSDGGHSYRYQTKDHSGNPKWVDVDNRWVVPYSPILSKALDAHINVEYCSSVKCIKYICKYITKGTDMITMDLRDKYDEIKRHQVGRWISTSMAVWRTLGFEIHQSYPPVEQLHVHLENFQRVTFSPDANLEDILNNPRKTTLMAYFKLCATDDFAATLLYEDVPAYCRFNDSTREFERRKRGSPVEGHPGIYKDHTLARMYAVHIRNTECFYLRMLLHHVRGPASFDALKTVNGTIHTSFEAACVALGLLHDDSHLDRAMDESVLSQSPYRIRDLYAIILVFCKPTQEKSLRLWETFKEYMSQDYLRRLCPVGEEVTSEFRRRSENRCLIALSEATESMEGKAIDEYGLPTPQREARQNMAYMRETSYSHHEMELTVSSFEPTLTEEQKSVYDEILHAVQHPQPQVFFLDSPGGSGKTHLLRLLLAKVRLEGKIALAVASSGIAATLLPGGKTAHSLFKIPIDVQLNETPMCNMSKQSNDAKVLKDAALLIWDECTMAHKRSVEAVDRSLRDIRDCASPFGGLTVVFSGDFRQILPVIERGTRADEINACLQKSYIWTTIRHLRLTRNMRVALGGGETMATFSANLLAIGNGTFPQNQNGEIRMDEVCNVIDVEGLISSVYPDAEDIPSKPCSWLCERAILAPTNQETAALNSRIQNKFEGEETIYSASNKTVDEDESVLYPTEFLATMNVSGLPPSTLALKVGSPVILMRNLRPPKLCNGTRLRVTRLHPNLVEATILTGVGAGEDVFIPRIPLCPNNLHIKFQRTQFPLTLSFAMTINKSQGQTLKTVGLDLRHGCFSHGQLYVACSRVTSKPELHACTDDSSLSSVTRNIVYQEVVAS